MSGYTVVTSDNVEDVLGDYPGEMLMFTQPLDADQVAFTYRRMPAKTGGKGSYGHYHKTQEEIYFVTSGRLQAKVDDAVLELGPKTALRVAPETVRSVWNDGPEDAELVIVSTKLEDARADSVQVPNFWPG